MTTTAETFPSNVYQTERPRNVDVPQAAAFLYGDWGTSKAYVVGLAFILAGYSSPWLVLMASILNLLVGINYMVICRCYPNGGGVYASVRHRSESLAMVGGFFLICDYIITASLSAFSAFSYMNVGNATFWAIGAIGLIGIINYFGPRRSGNFAFIVALCAFVAVLILGFFSVFHIEEGIKHLGPFKWEWSSWVSFVSIIVALSGVESIANMTGIMRLNPGTEKEPSVTQTSTPAILTVMLEVSILTTLFSLVVNALPGLVMQDGVVSAPGYPNVQDVMLRYMGEVFSSNFFGDSFGTFFGVALSISLGILLLSAVNTAIVAFNSLLFVMARDRQIPAIFCQINRFGVPVFSLFIATAAPMIVLLFAHDLVMLANLYAMGFVGAIATNLSSTSTDKSLALSVRERVLMFATALIMIAVEVTLFIEKPEARLFILSVVTIGLLLHALVKEQEEKIAPIPIGQVEPPIPTSGSFLCAVTNTGRGLDFALKYTQNTKDLLHVVFIREHKLFKQESGLSWSGDEKAKAVFDYIKQNLQERPFVFLYDVTDAPALNIIEHAKRLKANAVILQMHRANRLLTSLRGNLVTEIMRKLPRSIELIVVS